MLFRLPRLFLANEHGAVTIFAIVAFSMLIVVVGLVIDVGRVMNVHSQANSYADRVAIAAAAQLNRKPGALIRARDAAQGGNTQVDPGFRISLSGDTSIGVRKLTFLSQLGADPTDPFKRSPVPGDIVLGTWEPGVGFKFSGGLSLGQADRDANFVLVDTTRETEDYLFFPLLQAVTPAIQTSATVAPQAVAGFKQDVCNNTPIMVCNPAEVSGATTGAAFTPTPGQILRLRLQGNNNWNNDSFSLLDVPSTTSSSLRDYMARVDPDTACHGDRVRVERNLNDSTNQRNAIRDGLNVRFDMYSSALFSQRNNPQYAPARNVTKGLHTDRIPNNNPNRCTTDQSDTTIPFPRQQNWSRSNYWSQNFGGPRPATLHTGVPYLSATRYQIYREEIEHNPPGRVSQDPNGDGEQGAPYCSNQNGSTDALRDRRVLQVAVVNCVENRTRLRNGQDVQVEAYAEMFMTEPMANTAWSANNNELDLEIMGYVRPNLPEIAQREFPVLYR